MKKKLIYLFVLFILVFCVFLFIYNKEIIHFLINLDLSKKYFNILYIILTLAYFLSPLPVTFVILLNGFFFKEYGFILSIIQIFIGSLILKNLSNKINKVLKINFSSKKINFDNLSSNNYSIFISRLIVPYFLHNVYYGLIKVNLFKFMIIIFIAEIPMTYALSQIGKSFAEISSDYSISLYSLFTDINFYIPFLIIFILFIITNYFYKKKENK